MESIIAGFGGQGVLTVGKFLAYSGLDHNLNVSWLPSYGPEMRGGTSNCSVIISEEPVGSPVVTEADLVVAMNQPSMDKFESYIKPGGILIVNSDLATREPVRNDIKFYPVPSEKLSEEIGNRNFANMILLGAILEITKIVPIEGVFSVVKNRSKEKFQAFNNAAILRGARYVQERIENKGIKTEAEIKI